MRPWPTGFGAAAGLRPWTSSFAGGIVVHETAGLAAWCSRSCLGRAGRPPQSGLCHAWGFAPLGRLVWLQWWVSARRRWRGRHGSNRHPHFRRGRAHLGPLGAHKAWQGLLVGLVTGTIAGLASITGLGLRLSGRSPARAIAGILCQWAVRAIKEQLKIDDTLDVFAVHGVGEYSAP